LLATSHLIYPGILPPEGSSCHTNRRRHTGDSVV
jgi:hypothetical protein